MSDPLPTPPEWGWRAPGGGWTPAPVGGLVTTPLPGGGVRLVLDLHPGTLPQLHARLIAQIGPPVMPQPAFFSLWKAGDWRHQDATTVAADEAGHDALDLPRGVVLLDAYWASEVMSLRCDPVKHPQAQAMIDRLRARGTEVHLRLCPWVVVGTRRMAWRAGQMAS